MISLRRFASGCLVSLLALTGCANQATPKLASSAAGEWIAGSTDLRKTTAIVRVSPPARLKAAFEEVAARSDDPDYADFLRMHAGGGFGSGFLMVHTSAEGTAAFVVTNRHVIAESEEAEVTFGDGTTYKGCEVVFSSPKYDLAVLALPESALRALGPGLRPSVRDATDRLSVVAAGYPGVSGRPSYQVTDGKVSNAKFSLPELGLEETYVQHTAPIDPGSSGGPLTDESGSLVGVNVMLIRKRSSMFFAVPASAVVETVRHAHSLVAKKRSAQWMSAELEKACTTLSAELGSTSKSAGRLASFVSNAVVAERGIESYGLLLRTSVGPAVRQEFFQDPMAAMRRSVLIRLGVRSSIGGGATGTCAGIHPADATTIAEGKPVRLAIKTKDGGEMELIWTFEHGSWRVAGGDLIEAAALAETDEPPRPATPAKSTKPAPSKAGTKTNAKGAK